MQFDAVFLVGSTIKPKRSQHFSVSDRLNQTIETAKSIKNKISSSLCVLIEGSILSSLEREELSKYYQCIIELGKDDDISVFIDNNQNIGFGELKIMEIGLSIFKANILPGIKTKFLFKISGRYYLDNNFSLDEYDENKFTFKHKIDDGFKWDVYLTVLYSIPISAIDFYAQILKNGYELLGKYPEIERVFFVSIPESFVKRLAVLGVSGNISYNGDHFSG